MSDTRSITHPGSPSAAFLDFIRCDLDAVESRLAKEIVGDVRRINDATHHILSAGGKRLRPAMVALAARTISPDPPPSGIEAAGAAVELVHMATLVHDDVVDNTATRRNQPTANAVFGNGVAVLTGDFLLARAMRLLTTWGDIRLIRVVSEITVEMSEGEVLEILATGKPDVSREDYFEILRKKTAVFVEGCCRCGGLMAGANESQVAALADYGFHLGMAFQIADDLLDYTGDPDVTGKPQGSDLRDGRATLPFMIALSEANRTERTALLGAFGIVDLPDMKMRDVTAIMERYDGFDRTREVAREHVEQASNALAGLPTSDARACLQTLTDYVILRDR